MKVLCKLLIVAIVACFLQTNLFVEKCTGKNKDSFLTNALRSSIDRPLYCDFTNMHTLDANSAGVTGFAVGFDGEANYGTANGIDYEHKNRIIRIKCLNIGASVKYYNRQEPKYLPDFTLFKAQKSEEVLGLQIGTSVSLLENNLSQAYLSNINWAWLEIELGYNVFHNQNYYTLTPVLSANIGLKTIKPDALIMASLNEKFRKSNFHFIELGLKLDASYKSVSLTGKSKISMDIKDTYATEYCSQLSYTLWKNRKNRVNGNTQKEYLLNTFKVFLGYKMEQFIFMKSEHSIESISDFTFSSSSINLGASVKLGKLN